MRPGLLAPPLHLLPPPAEWSLEARENRGPISYLGATGSGVYTDGTWSGSTVPNGNSWTSHSSPSPGGNGTGETNRSDAPHRARLARAVAEKATALVNEAGIAARAGDRIAVDRLSRRALKLDPWNVDAWLWLAASCEDPKSARLCLEAVLLLDPGNLKAKRGGVSLERGIGGDQKLHDHL